MTKHSSIRRPPLWGPPGYDKYDHSFSGAEPFSLSSRARFLASFVVCSFAAACRSSQLGHVFAESAIGSYIDGDFDVFVIDLFDVCYRDTRGIQKDLLGFLEPSAGERQYVFVTPLHAPGQDHIQLRR